MEVCTAPDKASDSEPKELETWDRSNASSVMIEVLTFYQIPDGFWFVRVERGPARGRHHCIRGHRQCNVERSEGMVHERVKILGKLKGCL